MNASHRVLLLSLYPIPGSCGDGEEYEPGQVAAAPTDERDDGTQQEGSRNNRDARSRGGARRRKRVCEKSSAEAPPGDACEVPRKAKNPLGRLSAAE